MILNHRNAPLVVIPLSQLTGFPATLMNFVRASFKEMPAFSSKIEDASQKCRNQPTPEAIPPYNEKRYTVIPNESHYEKPKSLFFNLNYFPRFRTVTYYVPSPPIKKNSLKWWVDLEWVRNYEWNFLFPNNFLWFFSSFKKGYAGNLWNFRNSPTHFPFFVSAPCRSRNRWRPPPHRSNPRRLAHHRQHVNSSEPSKNEAWDGIKMEFRNYNLYSDLFLFFWL